MNRLELQKDMFTALTCDMTKYNSTADIVINTSFEHITEEQYDAWKSKLPSGQLIVLQSNNYDIPEHVRIAQSLDEFTSQAKLDVLFKGELDLPLYKRYMIIGTVS